MMEESRDSSPIFTDDRIHDDDQNTTDEIGAGDDLNDSRENVNHDLNDSTNVVHSDHDLNNSDDVPEINSKLSLREENGTENNGHGRSHESHQYRHSSVRQQVDVPIKPVEIKPVHIGDQKLRSKLKFEVVTAKVVEENGKKHVTYTVMMKRVAEDKHPAVICRRYNDFCYLYERILCSFHPSILGDFQFPKKVLMGNFKAEVITERTDAFHKFLNLIAQNDKLLYSDYFHAFLCSDEQNEAVSNIKLGKYEDAAPLLEIIFYIREKLVTICHVTVLECLIELVACLAQNQIYDSAYRYSLVAAQSLQLLAGHPEVDRVKVPFLKLASDLASQLGHDARPYNKQLSELRYSGIKTDSSNTLMDVVREKYIHTATRTARPW